MMEFPSEILILFGLARRTARKSRKYHSFTDPATESAAMELAAMVVAPRRILRADDLLDQQCGRRGRLHHVVRLACSGQSRARWILVDVVDRSRSPRLDIRQLRAFMKAHEVRAAAVHVVTYVVANRDAWAIGEQMLKLRILHRPGRTLRMDRQ